MARRELPDRDYVRETLSYNALTGEFRWNVRPLAHFTDQRTCSVWNGNFAGKSAGTRRPNGYLHICIDNITFRAHRLAWLMEYGQPLPNEIDHIDGDPSNNRISNLRAASHGDNLANSRKPRDNTSGVKGVRLSKTGNFEARIQHNGRDHYLGRFTTLEEAAAARHRAAERLFGEFARHK